MSKKVRKSHSLEKQYAPTDKQVLKQQAIAAGRFPCEKCQVMYQQQQIWNGRCKGCLRKLINRNKDDEYDDIDVCLFGQKTHQMLRHKKLEAPMSSYHAVHLVIMVVSVLLAITAIMTL